MQAVPKTRQNCLTESEVQQFHEAGYLGPLTAVGEEEMARIRARLDWEVLTTPGPSRANSLTMRHLDKRVVYDLVTHPAIIGRVQGILGPHLLLWACTFWLKEPGGKEIPWHQDRNYWPIEPIINITAWIAVDEVTEENGCLQVIPGSHRSVVPHIATTEEKWFNEEADPARVDTSRAIKLSARPGQFVLFNEKTLHHSEVNRSKRRRFAMGPRFTIPIVRIDHDRLFPGHAAILVSGEDYMGFNHLVDPPVERGAGRLSDSVECMLGDP